MLVRSLYISLFLLGSLASTCSVATDINTYQTQLDSLDKAHQTFLQGVPDLLQIVETDMTIFFRNLAQLPPVSDLSDEQLLEPLQDAYYTPEAITAEQRGRITGWLRTLIGLWKQSGMTDEARVKLMNAHNPKYVLRNYLAQQVIDKAEQGDYSMLHDLQSVLTNPYEKQAGKSRFAEKRPDWARHRAGCSMLSCSS